MADKFAVLSFSGCKSTTLFLSRKYYYNFFLKDFYTIYYNPIYQEHNSSHFLKKNKLLKLIKLKIDFAFNYTNKLYLQSIKLIV
jgi:hypothetical protein